MGRLPAAYLLLPRLQMKNLRGSLTTTIYDVNGTVIAQLKEATTKTESVKISQFKASSNAFVAVEDHRFFEHQG